MVNPLTFKIERFEEQFAVLRHETAGELRWPVANLPLDAKIGDSINLKISTQNAENDEKYIYMRKLLEELIN